MSVSIHSPTVRRPLEVAEPSRHRPEVGSTSPDDHFTRNLPMHSNVSGRAQTALRCGLQPVYQSAVAVRTAAVSSGMAAMSAVTLLPNIGIAGMFFAAGSGNPLIGAAGAGVAGLLLSTAVVGMSADAAMNNVDACARLAALPFMIPAGMIVGALYPDAFVQ